jgi:hypothetical protein
VQIANETANKTYSPNGSGGLALEYSSNILISTTLGRDVSHSIWQLASEDFRKCAVHLSSSTISSLLHADCQSNFRQDLCSDPSKQLFTGAD